SINSSLADLTIDTRTARVNNALQTEGDRDQIWQNYFDRMSEASTQLGNIRGQQADYLAQAEEMGAELTDARNPLKRAKRQAKAARQAAKGAAGVARTAIGAPGGQEGRQATRRMAQTAVPTPTPRTHDPVGRVADTVKEARQGARKAFNDATRLSG